MKRSEIVKIERTLARFQDGDLYTRVDTSGVGEYHAIAVRLETLRLSMLKIKDEQAQTEKRTSVSISSVAHDMKTPLAIISGYAECLSDGLDDKDYPALIAQKAEQMNEMVVGMVEAARNAKSDGEEHRVLYDARVLFGNILDKQQALAATKNIKLKAGKIPRVNIRADKTKIESVVQNLISNAVKYSNENTTIKVTFKRNGGFLCFCVKDEGIGIAKENIPLVFDQYFKEDTSRPSGASQGVGLYVTKCVVDDYGGSISVKSKKGKGSKFFVKLPIEQGMEERKSFTAKFDSLPLVAKGIIMLLFGIFWCCIYRFAKYGETRYTTTLVAGILSMALFVFMWPIDYISLFVYGKPTFLAD